jgi:hypothetical protein
MYHIYDSAGCVWVWVQSEWGGGVSLIILCKGLSLHCILLVHLSKCSVQICLCGLVREWFTGCSVACIAWNWSSNLFSVARPSNPDPLSCKSWWVSYRILCTYASWVAASRFSAYSTRHSACFFATEFFLMCSSYQNSVALSYTLMSCTMCKGTRGISSCTWRWFITQWVEWTMEQKNKVVSSKSGNR